MNASTGALVRRWGGRAVALTVTGIGLYVVAPSMLTLFGAWPRLRDVQPWWFVVLVALEACSMAALWWLTRLALAPDTGPGRSDAPRRAPVGWGTIATAQLAGNAASCAVAIVPQPTGARRGASDSPGPVSGARASLVNHHNAAMLQASSATSTTNHHGWTSLSRGHAPKRVSRLGATT